MRISSMLLVMSLCALLVLSVEGCGAIFGGSTMAIQVSGNPDGLNYTVNPTGQNGKTPTSLELERGKNYTIEFSKEGYTNRTVALQRRMRGGILALDIIFTGLLGVVVDAATGSWWKLSPEQVTVTLDRKVGADQNLPEHVNITLIATNIQEKIHDLRILSNEPNLNVHIQEQ